MAQQTFGRRFPFAGLFFVIAVALAIPLTTWSLNNVSTNTRQEAAGCINKPTWSTILGHTDYPTSVKYYLTLKNNCGGVNTFDLTATKPSGWTYQYAGCSTNTSCRIAVGGLSKYNVYVTITRPNTATSGTYSVTLKATRAGNSSIYSTKKLSYVVIGLNPTPTPKPLATPTPKPLATPTPVPAQACSSNNQKGYCPSGQVCAYNSNGFWSCQTTTNPTPTP